MEKAKPSPPSSPTPSGALLAIEALHLARAHRVFLTAFSTTLTRGAALGVFGENGAGKSTFLRALAGLCPHSGKITRAPLHYIGHSEAVKALLLVDEQLRAYKKIFCASPTQNLEQEITHTRTQIGLADYGKSPISDLSAGQRRRLALSRLLLAPRPLWLLDEPFASLDDSGSAWLTQTIKTHLQQGGALVLAGHNKDLSFLTERLTLC